MYNNIYNYSLKSIPVILYNLTNLSGNTNYDYISSAVIGMINDNIKIMEKEKIYIPVEYISINYFSNIDKIIITNDSIFYEDIDQTNIFITNSIYQIKTNPNIFDISGGKYIDVSPFLSTNSYVITNNNNIYIIYSNFISNVYSNYIAFKLNEKGLMNIITNKIPEITNKILFPSINIINLSNTNVRFSINSNYYITIGGFYSNIRQRRGADTIYIEFIYKKIFNDYTNITTIKFSQKESEISSSTLDYIKPLRKYVLNRKDEEYGDIYITTTPDNAIVLYNEQYIGRTPVYYPSILAGKHKIKVYHEETYPLEAYINIIGNYENQINIDLNKVSKEANIFVNSRETGIVLGNSLYLGRFPGLITNITLNSPIRFEFIPDNVKYVSYFTNLTLISTNVFNLDIEFKTNIGYLESEKKIHWRNCYLAWGLTTVFLGLNVYANYMKNYSLDMNLKKPDQAYIQDYNFYNDFGRIVFWSGIGSVFFSLYMTYKAINSEVIYLGLNSDNEFYFVFNKNF